MRLTPLGTLGTWLAVLCLLGTACSSDDSGGKNDSTENPANGDGDGDGDGDGLDGGEPPDDDDPIIDIPGGDGDGDSDAGALCQEGSTRACECADGESQGEQYCIQGSFVGVCNNCPCTAEQTEACFCEGGGIGSRACVNEMFGECVCADSGDGGVVLPPCPESFKCQDFGGMGAVCVPDGPQPGLPPMCSGAADCKTAGLEGAMCTGVPIVGMLCVQACTP